MSTQPAAQAFLADIVKPYADVVGPRLVHYMQQTACKEMSMNARLQY